MRKTLMRLTAGLLAVSALGTVPVLAVENDNQTSQSEETSAKVPALYIEEGDGESVLETGNARASHLDAATIAALIAPYQNMDYGSTASIGFFLANGENEAAAVVAKGVNEGYVNLNDPNDCASVQHMKDSMQYIRTCNEIRAMYGLPALNVDPVLMAISIVQTDASKGFMGHTRLYPVSENLAWGGQIGLPMGVNMYGNPFDSWYILESQRDYDRGHLENILRNTFTTTGFACGTNSTIFAYTNTVFGQTFGYTPTVDGQVYTVDQYENRIDSFMANPSGSGSVTDSAPVEEYFPQVDGAITMYRLYNPNSGEHFYTADANERKALISYGWKSEGVGWYAPEDGGEPVYRLYNENDGDHHYTADANERNVLVNSGWKDEGIGWYSDPAQRAVLYRQYNPNARAGSHNYTTDAREAAVLVQNGWIDEGQAWYGVQGAQ